MALTRPNLMPCLYNANLVLPDRIVDRGWVQIENELITAMGQGAPPNELQRIDAKGFYLAPGFIDLHVHGAMGSDFLRAGPEEFLTAANFHLTGGTTSLCPTAATATYEEFALFLNVWETARRLAKGRLLPVHLEGPHLAPSKAGAQDSTLMIAPTSKQRDWVLSRARKISQMTIAPELPGALHFIEALTQGGVTMSAGHTEASDADMAAAAAAGLTKVTHLFNAMSTASKRGLFRQAGTLEFAMSDDAIFCELVADGFHVSPTLLKLAYRAKGPERIALVSDSLAGTGLPEGTKFQLGSVRCKVGPGYGVLEDDSALAGSLARIIDLVRVMTQQGEVPLFDAVSMASRTPATILGIDQQFGTLEVGKAADLVLFDESFVVRSVWVAGMPVFDQADPKIEKGSSRD